MKTKAFLILGLLLTLCCTPVSAASTHAMGGKVTLPKTEISENPVDRNFNFGVGTIGETKAKKNMTISATFYIQKKLLPEGNCIGISPHASFHSNDKHFNVHSDKEFYLINDGGKIQVMCYHHYNMRLSKFAPVGSLCTVTEKSKYYVVKLKKVPLPNRAENNGQDAEFDTKNTYGVNMNINIQVNEYNCTIPKAISGNIYVDDLKLTAADTMEVDFEKKQAGWMNINYWDSAKQQNTNLGGMVVKIKY